MTKEEIIATAIREAFRCGKEAGEESQRQWRNMQDKIEAAKQGKLDHDMHMYDGIFSTLQKVDTDTESALNPDSEEVASQIGAIPSQRIGDTPEEKIAMLEHQCRLLNQENNELQKQCELKDATITELLAQLEHLQSTVSAGSPAGKDPSHCTDYSKGDNVLVSGRHFDDEDLPPQHGTVTGVLDDGCIVLITEEESLYNDVEFFVTYEYITKIKE